MAKNVCQGDVMSNAYILYMYFPYEVENMAKMNFIY